MKTIFSLALLCLMGCSSKPKPITYVHTTFNTITGEASTTTEPVPDTACNRAEACSYFLNGIWATQIGPVKVTPEQWQAAQDLYYAMICADKTHCEPVMTGPPLDRFPPEHGTTINENIYVPTGPEKFETFPPSENETHKEKPLVINQSAVNSPGSNIISGGNITINGKKQPPSGDAKQ